MRKLSSRTVDISNDPGFVKLKSLMSKEEKNSFSNDVLEALKELTILDAKDLELLPDGDFALILVDTNGNRTRKFPKVDLDNSIVSALYLIDSAKNIPYRASAIAASNLLESIDSDSFKYPRALQSHLRHELYRLKELISEADKLGNIYRAPKSSLEEELRKGQGEEIVKEKTARATLSDNDFVFVSVKNGTKHRLFPIDTPANLEKQAAYFEDNHKQFSLEHRHMFAKRLRDKSAELDTRLDGRTISKYASDVVSPTLELSLIGRIDMLQKTALVKNEKTAEYEVCFDGTTDKLGALVGYKKLLNAVSAGNVDKVAMDKIASTLHSLDKLSGLDKAYGKTLNDPYSSTYQKVAYMGQMKNLATKTIQYAGKLITDNQIKALSLGDLGGLVDGDTFQELKSDPIAVFSSLPIPYKSVIVEAIYNRK